MELVSVRTGDGLRLDGAFSQPHEPSLTQRPLDVFLLVHGTGSNFYAPGVLETFSRQAIASGLAVLRINTRGHDGISSLSGTGKSVPGGATYENVADCRLDLKAWIQFLVERGYRRIGLCGHSMGGVKSAYYLAHEADPAVTALILISSPRFHHETFVDHPGAAAFRRDYAAATAAVMAGHPEELIPATQPVPFLATAAGFVDKYGPANHYDLVRLLPKVGRPTLFILGTSSPAHSIGFFGLPESLETLRDSCSHLDVALVPGANVNYSGAETIPFELTWNWLEKNHLNRLKWLFD